MADSAHVISLDSLKLLKRTIWKFQEQANVALGEAESEMQRVQMWLENDQRTFWAAEVRKREQVLTRAKEALRMKQIFKGADGGRQSVVDEMKAVQVATRRLEEAVAKVAAVRKYTGLLQREMMMYKGQVQRFATVVQADLPEAAHELERVITKLEEYAAVGVGSAEMVTSQAGPAESMARPADERPAAADEQPDVVPGVQPDAGPDAQPRRNRSSDDGRLRRSRRAGQGDEGADAPLAGGPR